MLLKSLDFDDTHLITGCICCIGHAALKWKEESEEKKEQTRLASVQSDESPKKDSLLSAPDVATAPANIEWNQDGFGPNRAKKCAVLAAINTIYCHNDREEFKQFLAPLKDVYNGMVKIEKSV